MLDHPADVQQQKKRLHRGSLFMQPQAWNGSAGQPVSAGMSASRRPRICRYLSGLCENGMIYAAFRSAGAASVFRPWGSEQVKRRLSGALQWSVVHATLSQVAYKSDRTAPLSWEAVRTCGAALSPPEAMLVAWSARHRLCRKGRT